MIVKGLYTRRLNMILVRDKFWIQMCNRNRWHGQQLASKLANRNQIQTRQPVPIHTHAPGSNGVNEMKTFSPKTVPRASHSSCTIGSSFYRHNHHQKSPDPESTIYTVFLLRFLFLPLMKWWRSSIMRQKRHEDYRVHHHRTIATHRRVSIGRRDGG